ncbi:MAG: zinc ribbon domain-containing protein [Chloroflexota bacterium]
MDIGALFLLLSVVVLIGLFVARPFLEKKSSPSTKDQDQAFSTLLAERDRLISALQELDFDFTLGKIPAEDYPPMRADLLRRASDILRQIDSNQANSSQFSDAESRVEAHVAVRRADGAVEKPVSNEINDDQIEELIASRKAARKEKSAGFCPNCGKPVVRSDRFCPACGKSI